MLSLLFGLAGTALVGLAGTALAVGVYFDTSTRLDGAKEDRTDIRNELKAEIDDLHREVGLQRELMEGFVRAAASDIDRLDGQLRRLEWDICGIGGCLGVETLDWLEEELDRLSRCVRSFQDAADRIWSGYRGEWYWCASEGL